MSLIMLNRLLGRTGVVAVLGLFAQAAAAQCELTKLVSSESETRDEFGYSVAIEGDRVVVGARYDDGDPFGEGRAYVLRREGAHWAEEAKLAPSSATGLFGESVAISGELVVVGARFTNDYGMNSGAAYVFRLEAGEWIEEAKLVDSTLEAFDEFGQSVSIDGDCVVVGAPRDDDAGDGAGAVYVFRRDGGSWVREAKLTASDAANGDTFGYSVAISGNVIIVGAWLNSAGAPGAGAAYVFRSDGGAWNEEAKLVASDPSLGNNMGWSVAADGDRVVAGRLGYDEGAAYVFHFDGSDWSEEAKVTASDGQRGDWFGAAVALRGDRLIVGAVHDGHAGSASGSAYVFQRDGSSWSEVAKLTGADAAGGDEYGTGVAIDGGIAVVGSPLDDDAGDNSGSIYVYAVGGDCNENGVPDLCEILSGTVNDCDGDETPDECQPDADGDGVPDDCDVCPEGDDHTDTDGDGTPDACDPCPFDATGDSDGDGVCDSEDLCPGDDDNADSDGDGVPDCLDRCPGQDDADCDPADVSEQPGPSQQTSETEPPAEQEPRADSPADGGAAAQTAPADLPDVPEELTEELMPACGAGLCGAGILPAFPLALAGLGMMRHGRIRRRSA